MTRTRRQRSGATTSPAGSTAPRRRRASDRVGSRLGHSLRGSGAFPRVGYKYFYGQIALLHSGVEWPLWKAYSAAAEKRCHTVFGQAASMQERNNTSVLTMPLDISETSDCAAMEDLGFPEMNSCSGPKA